MPTTARAVIRLETPFLTEAEAGARLRLSAKTLSNWRSRGLGPAHLKFGGRMVYHIDTVDGWGAEQKAA